MRIFVEEKDLKSFTQYYNWFMSLIDKMPSMKNSLLVINTKYLMARMNLVFEDYEEAKPLIEEAMAEFKAREQFLQAIECELYLIAINM